MPEPAIATRQRLREVRYEIRGKLARRAQELERQGQSLIKLNIGNPGAFGFRAPEHLRHAIAGQLHETDAYTHQQGLPAAREALATHYRARGVAQATPERIFIGNGVSELIDLALRALLNPGDEVLLPSPDYPLWSAATLLNDGIPRHYPCRVENGFLPDPDEIERLIGPNTRALVLIQPNNPTGACYPTALLQQLVALAAHHRLLLLSDEIYDGIVYPGHHFQLLAPLAGDLPCLSFGGLSKVHRACGWRVGWALLSGDPSRTDDYRNALDLLAALRLCANVPGQFAIAPALTGADTITPLTAAGGRLYASRQALLEAVARSAFLSVVPPQGALYAFPGVDPALLPGFDDADFALELLENEQVLIVPGSSFNVPYRNHFRVTLLPEAEVIDEVFRRIEHRLRQYAEHGDSRQPA